MALQKQVLPLSLSKGIDTKTDPKQLPPGKLQRLENGTFRTINEIKKCPGNKVIPGTLTAGVTTAFYNDELVSLDGKSLYSYSSATASQFNKGDLPTTEISLAPISRPYFNQISQDSAINGTLRCFIVAQYLANGSTVTHYSIVDTVTGQTIVNNVTIPTVNPLKVLSLGNYFIILSSGFGVNSIFYYAINIATPTVLGVKTLITADFGTYADATIINGKLFVAYVDTFFNLGVYSLTSSLVLSSKYTVTSTGVVSPVSIFGDVTGNVWISYQEGPELRIVIINNALTTLVLASTVIAGVVVGFVVNLTGLVVGTTATVFFERGNSVADPVSPPSRFDNFISKVSVTITGTPTAAVELVRGMAIYSKSFRYSGINYFLACFPTSLQSTYFLINENGLACAKVSAGQGGSASAGILSEVNVVNSNTIQIATRIKDILVAYGAIPIGRDGNPVATNNFFSGTGTQSLEITFTQEARPKWYLGQNLHLGGGMLWMYDGAYPVEHGFNIYPEGLFASDIFTTGGAIGIGQSTASKNQVQYAAIYQWTDNQGQIHKSAVSIPLTVTLPIITPLSFTGNTFINSNIVTAVSSSALLVGQIVTNANIPAGTYIVALPSAGVIQLSAVATATTAGSAFTTKDTGSNIIRIPMLRLTAKTMVTITPYRTVNNGTIFYRLTDPKNPIVNDPTTDFYNYTDTQGDSIITGNEQIYTTGGEVDNIAAPAVSSLTSYRNRIVYLSPETPYSWGYSKQDIPGSPVEFNPQVFTQAIDPKGGILKACAEMDDKLILFKENLMFYIAGDGPTPAGTNNDFQSPQVISTDTGCNNPRSVVLTPVGVFFQSPKGIYLIQRNMSVTYIGADVEAYNNDKVTSAVLITTLNQVRFSMASGVLLVYDYFVQQWSVFTERIANDATVFQNLYTYIGSNGLILQEDPTSFTNNGAFIKLLMKSAWLSFGGVQGYERLYKMLILGDYKSPHTLTVSIAYDFTDVFSQVTPIPVLTDPGLYQYRVFPERQKCEAIQFQIEDSQSVPFGEGYGLSSMAFEIGIKQGLNKMPASKSYG